MSYQQQQPRYEPKYEGDPRASPQHGVYDPRFNQSPLPEYHQFTQPTYRQQQQQQQYQYPSDDRGYHRARPGYNDVRHEDRFYRQHNDPRQQQHREYEQPPQQRGYDEPYSSRRQEEYGHHHQQHQQQQQQQYRGQPEYAQHARNDRGSYDRVMPPAGRANNYNTRITDLLTSIRDPEYKDDSIQRAMEANKGYLVLMRFRPNDLADVVTAVQENLSTLAAHSGYAIGFAETADMHILMPSNQMMASDQWWDPRDRNGRSRYAVCCFWFKDINQAKRWFESARNIKQPDFPNNHSYQVIAVPLTYGQNQNPLPLGPEAPEVTLLWSEYPNIYERHEQDFLYNYSEPARKCMEYYGARPHVSVSRYKAGWGVEPNKFGQPEYIRLNVKNERVARAIRTGWVIPETFVNVSVFPSMDAVKSFYYSDRYQQIRSVLNRYSDPVFVAIRLRRVQGTSR